MDSKIKVKYSSKALDDLIVIMDYISYKLQNVKAANDLYDNIITSIDHLCLFPESCPILENDFVVRKDLRKKIVDNYVIIYYYDLNNSYIFIVCIFNSKMDLNSIMLRLDEH